jgi:hypothetical protein
MALGGYKGIHTLFIVDALSTKTDIPTDNWLLTSSWLVISSKISSCFCFQSKLLPAEASGSGLLPPIQEEINKEASTMK